MSHTTDAHNQLEEGTTLQLDFSKIARIAEICKDVIPVAVQNVDTDDVILVAYMNEKALRASIDTRLATFWSTSRNELWVKGKTSGETFELIEVYVNCEQNQHGEPRNCYYRRLSFETGKLENLDP